ncbi:MAG: DUF5615 family PIN-like protein [Acidobacteria bacterium]|nr:DUF5615 family PIN-like protein [Acidobacteriota bacterium]
MHVLIDMNLSPDWARVFTDAGHTATHWRDLGPGNADDSVILQWATEAGCIVFTHDLDFGTLLALGQLAGPSVVQLRGQEVTPAVIGEVVVRTLNDFESELRAGALVTIDAERARVRYLPLRRD